MSDQVGGGTSNHLFAQTIGHAAYQWLKASRNGAVLGVTSRGVFLSLSSKRVIFITVDKWHGPLTINLNGLSHLQSLFMPNDSVEVDFPDIRLKSFVIKILPAALIWSPDPFSRSGDEEVILGRCASICKGLEDHLLDTAFGDLIGIAADKKLSNIEKKARITDYLKMDGISLKKNDFPFETFLGLGTGLTPAGDDLIVGYLLAGYYLDRFGKPNPAEKNIMWKKTTALSEYLIKCAMEGSADERLMNSLRYLLRGEGKMQRIKEELLSYGSSSGMESLAGMVSAVFLMI